MKNKKSQKVQKVKGKARTRVEDEALPNRQKQNRKHQLQKNPKKFSDWANTGKDPNFMPKLYPNCE